MTTSPFILIIREIRN